MCVLLCLWRLEDNVVELDLFLFLHWFQGLNLGCQAATVALCAELLEVTSFMCERKQVR